MIGDVAVLPVKRFDRAKQRLGDLEGRAALASQMARSVLQTLCRTASLDKVLVVTRDDDARAAAIEHGAEVVDEPELHGHNAAAELGIARALELGARRVLLVPGDCPLLSAEEVDGLLQRHATPGVVIVPDRHGSGTNALLLEPPTAIRPSFGPGSRERHTAMAREAGAAVAIDEVPGLLLDVDTPDDLAEVERALRRPAA